MFKFLITIFRIIMIKKIIIAFVVYSIILLFVGRQLSFLPQIRFGDVRLTTSDLRKNVLQKFLKEEEGFYSIYYKDLKTGQEFGINENKVLTGASLNKLLIISYLYNLARDKKINLEDKITIQKKDIQDYGKKLGLLSTNMADNKTTAHDMGRILELIYSGEITSEALRLELLDFMKDTDFEDRLVRDIPKNVSVYHKAADAANMVHDVGIID